MIMPDPTAPKVAEYLLRIKAVELSPERPFTWSSGLRSPIYCDNRRILSHPEIRTGIKDRLVERIRERFGVPDNIVGIATGGIAEGVLVAQELELPFAYVRGKPKGHGKENAIEGDLEEGSETVLIEDLISTGKSSIDAVKRLRDAGYQVKGLVAIFSYGFERAEKAFQEAECPYSVLTDHATLTRTASEQGILTEAEIGLLEEWRQDPEKWSNERTS